MDIEKYDHISFSRVILKDFWGSHVVPKSGDGTVEKLNKSRTKGLRTAQVGKGHDRVTAVLDDAKIVGKQSQILFSGEE